MCNARKAVWNTEQLSLDSRTCYTCKTRTPCTTASRDPLGFVICPILLQDFDLILNRGFPFTTRLIIVTLVIIESLTVSLIIYLSFIHRLVPEIPLNEPDNKHCKANDIIFFRDN